jgi:hypothetical protein
MCSLFFLVTVSQVILCMLLYCVLCCVIMGTGRDGQVGKRESIYQITPPFPDSRSQRT